MFVFPPHVYGVNGINPFPNLAAKTINLITSRFA